jgi:DNA-binding MarR family transcriptional regulator
VSTDLEGSTRKFTALELLQLLWGLDHVLERASLRMLRDLGVTGPQRMALRLITRVDEIGPSELALEMRHHRATISSLLNRLERGGLIQRLPAVGDRRRTVIVATDRGRELGLRQEGTIESAVSDVLRDTDPDDVAACVRVFSALRDALEPLGGSEDD